MGIAQSEDFTFPSAYRPPPRLYEGSFHSWIFFPHRAQTGLTPEPLCCLGDILETREALHELTPEVGAPQAREDTKLLQGGSRGSVRTASGQDGIQEPSLSQSYKQ